MGLLSLALYRARMLCLIPDRIAILGLISDIEHLSCALMGCRIDILDLYRVWIDILGLKYRARITMLSLISDRIAILGLISGRTYALCIVWGAGLPS